MHQYLLTFPCSEVQAVLMVGASISAGLLLISLVLLLATIKILRMDVHSRLAMQAHGVLLSQAEEIATYAWKQSLKVDQEYSVKV